jgi:hypothetical protein
MRKAHSGGPVPAALGAIAVSASSLAIAQQKTAKACVKGQQADKATNQANGIQRAYLARCGAGSSKVAGDAQVRSSIKDVMRSIIDPSADVLWTAAGAIIDQQGVQDLSPKTLEEWLNVRHAAVRIIEGANLLMMPGREAAPVGTKSEAPGVELEPAEITALIKKERKSFDALRRHCRGLV